MADRTKIQWADATWNPVVGCSKIGHGCLNCYAEKMACRLAAMHNEAYEAVTKPGGWNGKAVEVENAFDTPKKWKRPRLIFTCSMADLFHHAVNDETIDRVANVARDCPQHEFLWLTKRNGRMVQYLRDVFVPRNIWAGISASTDGEADKACCAMNEINGMITWLSLEPLIEPVMLFRTEWKPGRTGHCFPSWIVIGAESGPNRRPCKIEWVRSLVHQCQDAGVAVFVKQLNINGRVSKDPAEWPEDLRVREYPR